MFSVYHIPRLVPLWGNTCGDRDGARSSSSQMLLDLGHSHPAQASHLSSDHVLVLSVALIVYSGFTMEGSTF